MKKNLLVTPSLYSLFLYFLLVDDWDKSDYVLSARIPLLVHDKLRSLGLNVYSEKKMSKIKFFAAVQENIEYLKYLIYSRNKHYDAVYGNDEFHLGYKYREQGIELIEDGPFNSESKKFFEERRLKQDFYMLNYWGYWFWRNYIPYGYDKCVKKIWHTKNIILSDDIKSKGILINLSELWKSKTDNAKRKILEAFSVEPSLLTELEHYSTVLVTQSLPIPEKDKINIYKELVKGIDESQILIKTHYAESTKYEEYFPKAKIISAPIPFQLFELMDFHPTTILTISSSAIIPFIKQGVKVTFLGTEIDDRIKKAYGVIRYSDIVNKCNQ
ncbi:glycosyltransferase family 52 [Prevotella sp.]|uniref:glycosyltransferase family 52 n=1 Tax=Prevotella sp. TaxID=59823 RepID=UPI003AB7A604